MLIDVGLLYEFSAYARGWVFADNLQETNLAETDPLENRPGLQRLFSMITVSFTS